MGSVRSEAAGGGYPSALLSRSHTLGSSHWLTDAAWLGGLMVAAGAAWRGLAAHHPAVRLLATGYLAVEGLFYLWSKLRLRHVSKLWEIVPDSSRLPIHFERFLQLRDVFCIREFLSGWFMGAPVETILRGNAEEFVAYGFHCRLLHQLSEPEQANIRGFLDDVERAWGFRFAPGYDPHLPFMCHLWEPLRAYHKPLVLFALTELAARTAHVLMWLMGFRPGHEGGFSCWHAPPLSPTPPGAATLSPPMSPVGARRPPGLSLRRHSTSEAVAGVVHHAAEHALDATLTVTSAAAAVVAAQHPHGGPAPLSPRPQSPLSPRSQSPLFGPAPSPAPQHVASPARPLPVAAAAAAPVAAPAPAGQESGAAVAAAVAQPQQSRRRNKGDSATDFAGALLVEPAAADPAEAAAPAPAGPAPAAASSPADSASSGAGSGSGGAAAASRGEAAAAGATTRPDVPVVFLHGVGFGVLPYLHLVRDMQHACGATPFFMVEVPHVALRLCWEARDVDDVAHAVAAMLARHGYRRACVVGHSYGSFVASRLCQLHPELVHSAVLMDPVAMMTCYPQLLFNFIYKEPCAANFTSLAGAVDLLRFLCSRDLTIAQAICRKFQWSELMIWPQDLPRRSLVVLSGQDDLVPCELVMAHLKLTGHPAKVMHHPELGHGGILLDPAWQAQFVANLRAMLAAQR